MVKNGQNLCEVTAANQALLLSKLATHTALLRQTEEQELVTNVLRRLHEHRTQGLTPNCPSSGSREPLGLYPPINCAADYSVQRSAVLDRDQTNAAKSRDSQND